MLTAVKHLKKIHKAKHDLLFHLSLLNLQELEFDMGILASGRNEMFGALFGRDSLITSLKLLQAYERLQNEDCLRIVKKTLVTLSEQQGKVVNTESGEEPGKILHEFRTEGHEFLTKYASRPWFLYEDQVMRNYDTIDATPLYLITMYRYWQTSQDNSFIKRLSPNIRLALHWLLEYADTDKDGLFDFVGLPDERKHGGLTNHMWMDSFDATFHEDGTLVRYPLAPIEAQAYGYLALYLWSRYFTDTEPDFSAKLTQRAQELKVLVNERFLVKKGNLVYFAQAIDGVGKQLTSVRSNMGHCLWASTKKLEGQRTGILADQYIPYIIERLMARDMFEPKAGIRTLSAKSKYFQPNSYHNGSIWPHDNSLIAEGLENYGYTKEATKVRKAYLQAVAYFNTPIELYVYWNNQYSEWTFHTGQTSCKLQAWSAASILADTLLLAQRRRGVLDTFPTASLLLMLFQEVQPSKFQNIVKKSLAKIGHVVPVNRKRS